jgi:hypothetical protein
VPLLPLLHHSEPLVDLLIHMGLLLTSRLSRMNIYC